MAYRITATRMDRSGVRVWSSNAETLGEYFQQSFPTRELAELAADNLDDEKYQYGLNDAQYVVTEDESCA